MRNKKLHAHKIGGAGVGSVERLEGISGKIIPTFPSDTDNIITFSAVEKVTKLLMSAFEAKELKDKILLEKRLDEFYSIHQEIISGLPTGKSQTQDLFEFIFKQLKDCIYSEGRYNREEMYSLVLQFGELTSSHIVSSYLSNIGIDNTWFDARRFIKTKGKALEAYIAEYESERLITKGLPRILTGSPKLIVTQGFIGRDLESDENTVLPLNGSDISAAFFAFSLWASSLTYYKDIFGVWKENNSTKDSSDIESEIAPEAYIKRFKGAESYPIEPRAIEIVNRRCIPVRICPFANPSFTGTWIRI